MQRVLAISWVTLKAAFRFRLVLVLTAILIGGVILLPLLIKDDGTARGFTQILLTYTLSFITALLGFATLWLACGTLAREVEEAQIQMVVVKPVARWQIWLGKWLGILALNVLLLLVSAGAVYGLLLWRAQSLPEKQRAILQNEILVARASVTPPVPDYSRDIDELLQRRLRENPVAVTDMGFVRKQIEEQLKASEQIVPPEHLKWWVIDLGLARHVMKDRPIHLRFKFNSAQPSASGTYYGYWIAGEYESPRSYRTELMSLAADTFHEIVLPPNLWDEKGTLTLNFVNRSETVLLFPLEDGVEILYREGGFGLNYFRGVGVIFCWLAFLAALGLAASSFLSFPVAAFLSLAVLVVGFSTGTMALVLEQGTVLDVNHETGMADKKALVDYIALPVFSVLLQLINLVRGFSPIDSLSTGRSVSWFDLAKAFGQIVLLLGGLLAAFGIYVFHRRELASAQTFH